VVRDEGSDLNLNSSVYPTVVSGVCGAMVVALVFRVPVMVVVLFAAPTPARAAGDCVQFVADGGGAVVVGSAGVSDVSDGGGARAAPSAGGYAAAVRVLGVVCASPQACRYAVRTRFPCIRTNVHLFSLRSK
jgi:hypothetical protein